MMLRRVTRILREVMQERVGEGSLRSRLKKNFSISLAGSAAAAIVGVGTTAVLTKSLDGTADYGRLLIAINLYGFLLPLLGVRAQDLIFRFYPEFEERGDVPALRVLIGLALLIAAAFGVLIGVGGLLGASWIAHAFYEDAAMAPLFKAYAAVMLFRPFQDVYVPLLRLSNRFAVLVVPQVFGRVITLILLGVYFYAVDRYALVEVVGILVLGEALQAIPPLLIAGRQVWPLLRHRGGLTARAAWRQHWRAFAGTLFQTNVVGYLKLAAEDGGLFLLGIIAGPSQVALYGIARQLSKPLSLLQRNVQAAIAPEVVRLWARRELARLHRLVGKLTRAGLLGGGVLLVLVVMLARPVLLWVATPAYLEALPVFYVFFATYYVTFVSLVYYPLALCMGALGRRNLVVAVRLVYLGGAIALGLNALSLAAAQLGGALTTRLFNDLPLLRRLGRLADPPAPAPQPATDRADHPVQP